VIHELAYQSIPQILLKKKKGSMQLLKVFLPPSLNAKTCQDFATYKGGQKGNSTMILL
jgi:hypothetical protein